MSPIQSGAGKRAALDLAINCCKVYAEDVEPSDGGSVFKVAVSTEQGPLVPQEIRASSLVEALTRAIAVPFPDWFPPDDDREPPPTMEERAAAVVARAMFSTVGPDTWVIVRALRDAGLLRDTP